jgi:ribosome-associated translation inhibitor RaiA
MDIIIESPGFKASNELESFVREKVGKLEHQKGNIIRADVTLFGGPASDPASCHCEIRLEVSGNDHFAKKSAESYEQAIVETVETLQKVMQRAKDKNITRRHDGNGLAELGAPENEADIYDEE